MYIYQNLKELSEKVDWEGGIYDTLQYGITSDQFSPEIVEQYPEFVQAWDDAVEASEVLRVAYSLLSDLSGY